jgi:hypothetical protein
MRFKYKSIRVLGEETVGSGRDYIVRQTRYDLGSVQDHEVDVPLSAIFADSTNLGCAGGLAIVVTVPVGIVALLAQYQTIPRVPGILPWLVTFGLVFGICVALIYPTMCLLGIKTAALAIACQQRQKERVQFVPAEEWESFLQRIGADSASVQGQKSRFDAVERHGNP